jgi:NTE family protein
MNAVEWRAKQIQYASSTPRDIQAAAARVNLRHARHMLNANMPAGQRMDLVHIIYHPTEDQIPASDAEFSRASIEQRRLAGLADMRRALKAQPWLRADKPPYVGCMTHRVTEQGVTTLDAAK